MIKLNIKILILGIAFLGIAFFSGENAKAADATTGAGSDGQIQEGAKNPGNLGAPSELIKCGRAGQPMCTLCDLIGGLNNIIRYIEKIAIVVGLLAITIGGVMYVVSGGNPGLTDKAKTTMKNAGIGFVIIFASWIIINTTIQALGVTQNLGMNNITTWGVFDCNARGK